jgi:hypothetical protein
VQHHEEEDEQAHEEEEEVQAHEEEVRLFFLVVRNRRK